MMFPALLAPQSLRVLSTCVRRLPRVLLLGSDPTGRFRAASAGPRMSVQGVR
jgi:hypothetical protein